MHGLLVAAAPDMTSLDRHKRLGAGRGEGVIGSEDLDPAGG